MTYFFKTKMIDEERGKSKATTDERKVQEKEKMLEIEAQMIAMEAGKREEDGD